MSERPPISPRSPRAALEPEQVPPPPKRSERARNPFVVVGNAIITLLLIGMLGTGAAYYYGKKTLEAPGPLQEDKTVVIPSRAGMTDIADVLRDVIGTIVEGKVVQHSVTLPEGLTSEQIVARLTDNDLFSGTIREIPREGTMLPETYKFPRGTTREQVIQRMQAAQKRLVAEIWEHRSPDVPLKSPEQLVTLASIVEKETGRADERSRVAAVFANRLQKKMKLQSDPTIIYGLVGGKGTLGRPIKRSEISQPSPYNTYTIDGLPPGPIANPGRASLEAAANPARTRDLFFVADGTGGHAFSESLDAHAKNVAKLRSIEKQTQNDRAELPDEAPATAATPAPAEAAQAAPAAAPPKPAKRPAAPRNPPAARQGAAQAPAPTVQQ